MVEELIAIEDLWNKLIADGHEPHKYNEYEVLDCDGIETLTYGNKYVDVKWLSRHKTPKYLLKIVVKSEMQVDSMDPIGVMMQMKKFNEVIVTTDHVCMVYNKDHFFENTNAKNLKINDYVSVYDESEDKEYIGTIVKTEDLGTTDEWVYDLEVEDDMHAFYANDILVHNSQFINLQCVTDFMKKKYNLPKRIKDWNQKYRNELWKTVSDMTEKEINPFVRNLVHEYCKTTQQDVLTYELEYMGDCGVYESKKHYFLHKIFEEGDIVDKNKVTGIELKKGVLPKGIKSFLEEIYVGVVNNDWEEKDYNDYVNSLYDKFKEFSIDEISFWKGYGTERQAVGFLQMETGTTGIAKACTYYNQILAALKLGKKYEELRVGDKVRFCYIEPSNKYGISCIAYKPGQWPKEFAEIFKPDYHTMFKKIILDPLKRFREAAKFADSDPSKQIVQDIFAL